MKKLILQLPILIAILVLVGCSSDNDVQDVQEFEQISVRQVFDGTEGFIYTGTDEKIMNKFRSLNDDELKEFFLLTSKRLVSDISNEDINMINERQDYHYNIMLGIHKFSMENLGKRFNNLSNPEIVEIMDNHIYEIIGELPSRSKSFFEKINDEIELIENLEQTRVSCPNFQFSISSYKSGYGSRSCLYYANADNPGESSCDYEFAFHKNQYSNDYGLKGNDWRIGAILSMGGIYGRIDFNNRIRFLIGKGRILAFAMTASYVKNNLKANWN